MVDRKENFFSQYNLDKTFLSKDKSKLNIGIFGSFDENKIKILISLKKFLMKNGYKNSRMSLDCPQSKSELTNVQNLEISEKLIDHSDIHILLFFKDDKNPLCNESSKIELSKIDERHKKNVLIFIETETRNSTLCKGIIDRRKGSSWENQEFEREDLDFVFESAAAYCYNCLLEDCSEL